MAIEVVAAWLCVSNVNWRKDVPGSRGGTYAVRFEKLPDEADYQYGWTCTCKGFEFRGTCRHVVETRASGERCGWNGTLEPTAECGRDVDDNPICPDCKGEITAMNVGV
jgi:hypothetical protein